MYGRRSRGETLGPGDAAAVEELRAWGMLAAGEDMVTPAVLPPRSAVWPVTQKIFDDLEAQIQTLRTLPSVVQELGVHFEGSRTRAAGGSEFLADRGEINDRIGAILAGAQEELLGAHPHGPRSREQMELGIPRDTAALERGVAYRTLYRDGVRDDAVTSEWASTMAPRGVHFRTLADPFERVIIVDRKIAVISNYVIPDAPEGAAWIITDLAMVGFCVNAFEQEWRRAAPWHGERRERGQDTAAGRLSEVQRAILRCLSEGETQDGAARRLGMSKRKLQRELDLVRALWVLPAATVAQLTFRWAGSPERNITVDTAA